MMFNSIDLTLICLNTTGVVLFISYLVFAYWVTHKGDFYHIRRWKAALWFANVFGVILSAFLLFYYIPASVSDSPEKNLFGIIGLIIRTLFPALVLVVPLLFVIAFGTHYRLKWWLSSDDFLDNIWKDPNKEHKSPIQEL